MSQTSHILTLQLRHVSDVGRDDQAGKVALCQPLFQERDLDHAEALYSAA